VARLDVADARGLVGDRARSVQEAEPPSSASVFAISSPTTVSMFAPEDRQRERARP
jgi:hypothetical protein